MEEKEYYVYMHSNKINGHVYIGITKQKLSKRWKQGRGYDKCLKFYNAINKYGWDTFKHMLLCKTTKDKALFLEHHLVQYYKKKGISYNIAEGGESSPSSMLGKHHSKEAKTLISEASKRMWKQHKEDLSKAIREGKKKGKSLKGVKKSNETKLKMRKCHNIPVRCYDLYGNYIKTYSSGQEASRELNLSIGHIKAVCNKKRKQCAGFQWRYDDSSLVEGISPISKIIVIKDKNNNEIKRCLSISEAASFLNVSYTLILKRLNGITKNGYKSFDINYLENYGQNSSISTIATSFL